MPSTTDSDPPIGDDDGGLVDGEPMSIAEEIAAYAKDVEASYVVVGTSAPAGVTAVLLGSIADAIMRRASSPVLIVRQGL